MASDETVTFRSSLPDDDFDYDIDDGYDLYRHPHPHNMSRLSVCTSSTLCSVDDEEEEVDNAMAMYVSRLSIESFEEGDGDADGELSDSKQLPADGLSSGSENESSVCYSLPGTPPRRRNRVGMSGKSPIAAKDYASDNEAQKGRLVGEKRKDSDPRRRRRRSRRMLMERGNSKTREKEEQVMSHGWSGESDGVKVKTRPKGGRKSLCMDLEEMKACRDLGFELEQERTLEIPSRISLSNSTLDTSSGGNSPIAKWCISAPGDDPRDVKARLKVWAQAVAMASAPKYGT